PPRRWSRSSRPTTRSPRKQRATASSTRDTSASTRRCESSSMSSRSFVAPVALAPYQPLPLLRPLEILELLDESFDLYKRNFRLFFGIAVLVNTPVSLLGLAARGSIPTAVGIRILASLISLLTMTALTRAALDRILGRPMTI